MTSCFRPEGVQAISKRAFAVTSMLVLFLSFGAGPLHASDAYSPRLIAAAQTPKQKCAHTCRARYHDCVSKKQIPPFECQYIYQDCNNFTCSALQ
jgi:hypothetical protein